MKDEAKYQKLMAKYLAGELSSRERANFMSWVEEAPEHQQFFSEMISVWTLAATEPPLITVDTDRAWERVNRATSIEKPAEPVATQANDTTNNLVAPPTVDGETKIVPLWRKNIVRLALAASVLLAVGLFVQHYFSPSVVSYASVNYQTGADEQLTVTLSDGSQVVLNENTSFTFNPSTGKRLAKLTGEAFFDIKRLESHPFEIISGATKTIVLGTSFNVRAYPDEATVEVNVTSGEVAFTEVNMQQRPVLLQKGSTGIFDRTAATVSKSASVSTNANAWKTKELIFNDETMQQVIPTLERYFEIDLKLSDQQINRCSLNGEFKQPELDELLQIIAFTLNVEVEKRDDGSYVLNGEGCE